jgi:hypothetical protein
MRLKVRTTTIAAATLALSATLAACASSQKTVSVSAGGSTSASPSPSSSFTRPAKPASEHLPDSGILTVALHIVPGTTNGARSTTLTNATTIAQIAAELNALPTQPRYATVYHCPMEIDGPYLTLDFRDSASGPVLAHVTVPPKASGVCSPAIQVTVGGVVEPRLDDSGQPNLYTNLMQAAGLNAR